MIFKFILSLIIGCLLPYLQADKVYVANELDYTVSVINAETDDVTNTIDLLNTALLRNIAITPDGLKCYVVGTTGEGGFSGLFVINTTTNQLDKTIELSSPYDIAITPSGKKAYVTRQNLGKVSVVNITEDKVVGSPIDVGNFPSGIAITPDGKRAYVANHGGDNVSVIDTGTNETIGSPISVGDSPVGIAITPDGTKVYVANTGDETVSVINTSTQGVKTIEIGDPTGGGVNPEYIAITPNGEKAYVTTFLRNSVYVIDTKTDKVVGSPINVGDSPSGIAITSDGAKAYVANSGDNTVSVIDTKTDKVIGSAIGVGVKPFGVAILQEAKAPLEVSATASSLIGVQNEPFSFQSTVKGGISPYSYLWRFGDDQESTDKDPTHAYSFFGVYIPTLVVTDKQDTKASSSITIRVLTKAQAVLKAARYVHMKTQKSIPLIAN